MRHSPAGRPRALAAALRHHSLSPAAMTMPSPAEIRAARARLAGRVHVTPMLTSATIADRSGVSSLSLKCETLQKTGSFKARGALNAVSQLDEAARVVPSSQ